MTDKLLLILDLMPQKNPVNLYINVKMTVIRLAKELLLQDIKDNVVVKK